MRRYRTCAGREEPSLLPARIEDYVGPDNPARAIDAFVRAQDMAGHGFKTARRGYGRGQPPYDPADLLKLYLYGYLNRIRSSRALERETGRNLEVIWLLHGQRPCYWTIAKFRADNAEALKKVNRAFVLLLRGLELVKGELVAVDGSFFRGDASKKSIVMRKRLAEEVEELDRDIKAYQAALAANDAVESAAARDEPKVSAEKMTALVKKYEERKGELAKLDASGETQLSRTDADARYLTKRGESVAGYNVQIAVDDANKLIVASAVVNEGNDAGQLPAMAKAAKEALGVETLEVVADAGYHSGEALKSCEDQGIVAYVPQPDRSQRLTKEGRFTLEAFEYDAAANVYRCPNGAELRPLEHLKQDHSTGKLQVRYLASRADCKRCPLRSQCLTEKARRREILRWVHHDVIDRHRARMANADAIVRRRKGIVEHPFGTLKCRAGYLHFLVRGLKRVGGEWSLMVLCYNFGRVLSILGIEKFMAYVAALAFFVLRAIVTTTTRRLTQPARRCYGPRFARDLAAYPKSVRHAF